MNHSVDSSGGLLKKVSLYYLPTVRMNRKKYCHASLSGIG